LMLAPKARPGHAEGEAILRLGQGHQQAAHLGDRQRDQILVRDVGGSPFFPASSAVAWRRVTSR
jgi:hypothetical protein